jgi:predicted SnoaL-like aldol condensation-catalyzing enzyme
MSKLVIKGKSSYIKYFFAHLRKEHPSTRKRMKIVK